MKDCELFNVCSTEIRWVVISISSIICVYLAISNKYVFKYVRIQVRAYSSTREQSNKRSRTRLKTESETGERR